MTSFNLLTEPWIPAITTDGTKLELGIEGTIARAHDIKEIVDPSPLLQFGMHRLLVAFITNVFRYDIDDIADAIARGRFDMDKINAYCQKWNERFDMFDEKHPFYQVPVNPGDEIKRKTPAYLFKQFPTSTGMLHFSMNRIHDNEHAISPAACARGLCAIPPFSVIDGGGYSPGVNGSWPPLLSIVRGKNVFETLVLNVPSIHIEENSGNGTAAWESDEITIKKEVATVSTLEGMTFQSRRVHLFPGDGGTCTMTGKESSDLVREIVFEQGLKLTGEWKDPSAAYLKTDKGRSGIRLKEGEDIWRDTGPITMFTESTRGSEEKKTKIVFNRPHVIHQWDVLVREKLLPWRFLFVDIYGLRSKPGQAKIYEWRNEAMSMPVEVMNDPDAGNHVLVAMNVANDINYVIGVSIKKLYPRDGKGNKNALNTIISNARHDFWSAMEPVFRDDFIRSIARRDKNDVNAWTAVDDAWKKKVIKTGAIVVNAVIESVGSTARIMVNGVAARETYNNIIYNKFSKKNVKKQ